MFTMDGEPAPDEPAKPADPLDAAFEAEAKEHPGAQVSTSRRWHDSALGTRGSVFGGGAQHGLDPPLCRYIVVVVVYVCDVY